MNQYKIKKVTGGFFVEVIRGEDDPNYVEYFKDLSEVLEFLIVKLSDKKIGNEKEA